MNPKEKVVPLRQDRQVDNPTPRDSLLAPLLDEFRRIVAEELRAIAPSHVEDRLLDADQAAEVLSVSPDWLYRHARKLPFTRKLGPKMLRFSAEGIQKYIATRKLP